MAFEHIVPEEGQNMTRVTAGEDIYRDDEGNLVPPGPDARVLVARAGRDIPPEYTDKVTKGGKLKTAKQPTKARKPAANKSRKQEDDK